MINFFVIGESEFSEVRFTAEIRDSRGQKVFPWQLRIVPRKKKTWLG